MICYFTGQITLFPLQFYSVLMSVCFVFAFVFQELELRKAQFSEEACTRYGVTHIDILLKLMLLLNNYSMRLSIKNYQA